jgi:TolB-like protein
MAMRSLFPALVLGLWLVGCQWFEGLTSPARTTTTSASGTPTNSSQAATRPQRPPREKPLIIVLDLKASGVDDAARDALSQRLWYETLRSGQFLIVPRDGTRRLLEDRGIVLNNPYGEPIPMTAVGRALNADYLIFGSVGRVGDTTSLDAQLLDVERDRVIGVGSATAAGRLDNLLLQMPRVSRSLLINWREDQTSVTASAAPTESRAAREASAPPPRASTQRVADTTPPPAVSEAREAPPSPPELVEEIQESTEEDATEVTEEPDPVPPPPASSPSPAPPIVVTLPEPAPAPEPHPSNEDDTPEVELPAETPMSLRASESMPVEAEPEPEPGPEAAATEPEPTGGPEVVASPDPTAVEVSQLDGELAQARRDLDQAITDVENPYGEVAVDPQEAQRLKSQALQQAQGSRDRVRLLEQALALDPRNPDLLAHLARARISNLEYDRALQDCRLALKSRRDDSVLFTVLGSIEHNRGSHAAAVAAQQRALELDESNYFAQYNLALSMKEIDRARAITSFRRFISMAENIPEQQGFIDRARGFLEELGAPDRP